MIDLHLHTTASDGRLSPEALVSRAHAAGLTIISVTDHDTVAGHGAARRAAAPLGMRVVPGIEITAIERDRDVHVLGYFVDPGCQALEGFLRDQRDSRVHRVKAMAARLESQGYRLDIQMLLDASAQHNRSIGRPALADALVAAGHAVDRDDAFERLLGRGRPAYVPRTGPPAADVVAIIHRSGGVASLAHPGVLGEDSLIPSLVAAGLDALEVWHSDHLPAHQEHYVSLAARFRLACSGGSDFHGDGMHRAAQLGAVTLPREAFAALEARVAAR